MMNKKLIAALVAVLTVNASMFALLGDIVEGTFDTVATAPVDAVTPDGRTWEEKRQDRRIDKENRQLDRQERRLEREERRDRYYSNY